MLSLSQLKKCLQQKPQVSLQELSIALKEDCDTVLQLLQHFILRGQVIECPYKPACGTSCHSCPAASIVFYAWQANN